jgi:hypothetical protein
MTHSMSQCNRIPFKAYHGILCHFQLLRQAGLILLTVLGMTSIGMHPSFHLHKDKPISISCRRQSPQLVVNPSLHLLRVCTCSHIQHHHGTIITLRSFLTHIPLLIEVTMATATRTSLQLRCVPFQPCTAHCRVSPVLSHQRLAVVAKAKKGFGGGDDDSSQLKVSRIAQLARVPNTAVLWHLQAAA